MHPLEPDLDQSLALGRQVLDRVVSQLAQLSSAASHGREGANQLALSFVQPQPPEHGRPLADILDQLERGLDQTINTAGPGYLAYIPGGGLYASALAALWSAATNRYVGLWEPAPPLVQLEQNVISWLCDLVGFGPDAGGVLTSGGSLANLIATVAARDHHQPEDFLDGTVYVSNQAHLSVAKAARVAGFRRANVRLVPTCDQRLDPVALEQMLTEDRAAGLRPCLLVGNAGTTNTGAVDPLEQLALIAERHQLWFHVDAAYGGFFLLTERGRQALAGIERADSVTLDPHKGLFLPYGTGAVVVRQREHLRASFFAQAEYLQDLDTSQINFSDLSPEQSRGFRGLQVWLPLQLHGLGAFRDCLQEKLDLADWAYARLAAAGFDMLAPPLLSLVAFRHPEGDQAGRRLLEAVLARKEVFLSSTLVDGRYTLRICVLCFRTHRPHVKAAVEALIELART
ncbi:MAG: aspartate aminotransferase family protein [Vulcanimicrobiota bacterium]